MKILESTRPRRPFIWLPRAWIGAITQHGSPCSSVPASSLSCELGLSALNPLPVCLATLVPFCSRAPLFSWWQYSPSRLPEALVEFQLSAPRLNRLQLPALEIA